MVGGTSLNPWVREAVQAELTNKVEFGIDPVTVVARGAAIFTLKQLDGAAALEHAGGGWLNPLERGQRGSFAPAPGWTTPGSLSPTGGGPTRCSRR